MCVANLRTAAGVKHFHHHVVGDLTLAYESRDLRAEPDLTVTMYTAEPDSPTAHARTLLASRAATSPDTGTRAEKDHDVPETDRSDQ